MSHPRPLFLLSAASAAVLAVAAILFAGAGSPGPQPASADHHLMRIHAVMGGLDGNGEVQYVELRMTSGGQTNVGGKKLCFFDIDGDPWATFTFPNSVGNGASGSSILIGSPSFDAEWDAGSPDFTFGPGNTVSNGLGVDVEIPVPHPAGKVSFGSSCGVVDSVAYGSDYAGAAENPPNFLADLPIDGAQAIHLVDAPSGPKNNSEDYEIVNVNITANQPRNNAGDQGPLSDGQTPTATPDPTPTASPTATPGPSPTFNPINPRQGDTDCDTDVDENDAIYLLEYTADLEGGEQPAPCFDLQQIVDQSGFAWGDVNCDGEVNAIDALHIFAYLADVTLEQDAGNCFPIGNVMT